MGKINAYLFTTLNGYFESPNMTILGSGSIVTQFAEHKLLDSLQIMIDPVSMSSGTPIFQGLKEKLSLNLTASKMFKNGVVLLEYELVK